MLGDATAWADRIAKGNDVLYASGVNGVPGTGMIAKGGCMQCSDEEIHAAVDYMVAGSQ
jgi:cytochrome c5